MCGIAGMYSYSNTNVDLDYFNWCLSTMKHRGPDAQEIWHNNHNYITAFARLAIRDLSANGNQPMMDDKGNYCISFNGEIYNTSVLQARLQPFQISYRSSSDTEVLLYALIHLGVDTTLRITDGIFAFAFYDITRHRLVLARDRMGVKPLYIGTGAEGIVYSSQYDHIINHRFCKDNAWNESAVAGYLSLGYMAENSGVINHTRLLPHGYYTIVENGLVQSHRYYGYGTTTTNTSTQKNIDVVLEQSVSSQLVSDVAVGTFMSGGVDSTLVSYFANRHTSLQSFTLGIKESHLDETQAAAAFAGLFHTRHHTDTIHSADLLALLQENAQAFTEPFADFSSLPTLMLSKFTRQFVTVALSGDGGDELFWGYPRNCKALTMLPYYSRGKISRKLSLLKDKLISPSTTDISRHWGHQGLTGYYYSALFITGASAWVPAICKAVPEEAFFLNGIDDLIQDAAGDPASCMNILRKMEMDIHLQRILLKVDRASMYHSLEVRVPFLGNDMLDYSQQYIYSDCIQGKEGKINLKESLIQKSSAQLVKQPKKGFVIPMDEWLRKEIKAEVTEKILDMPVHLAGMFHKKQTAKLLEEHMSGRYNHGWFIWAVYSLVTWDATHRNKYA